MKTQLLEDIGENAGRYVERIPLPAGPTPSAAAPASVPAAVAAPAPEPAPEPAPAAAPVPTAPPSARVWQVRAPRTQSGYRQADASSGRSAQFRPRTVWQAPVPPVAEPAAPQVDRAPPPTPASPTVQEQDIADEVAEIERALKGGVKAQPQPQSQHLGDHEQEIADELAAIEHALQASEAAAGKPAARKGRLLRLGMAGSVVLFAALLAGTVHWYYRESKIDDTMAVLATSAAQAPAPASTRVASLPPEVREPSPAAPPPMVMLERAAPAAAAAPLPAPVEAAPAAPVEQVVPAAAPAPAPTQTEKADAPADTPAPVAKPRRKEVVAKAADDEEAPARPKPRPQPAVLPAEPKLTRDQQMEETLRLCRAAGYHTTQCLEKRCQATRYGLACRG